MLHEDEWLSAASKSHFRFSRGAQVDSDLIRQFWPWKMTSARGTQQRIHSGNCDGSNNSQLCSQLASTWGPEHRCLAVVAVDEGAERAVCLEGVAKAILSEIVQMIDPAAALRKKNRASVQTSGANSDLAPVIAGPAEAAQSTMGGEALGMRLRSGWALRMRLRFGWAKLHAPGKRKARKPAVCSI
ncbi:hypothetical protein Plhal304r1_c007g0030381 [Plasmopara halstedii]